MALNLSTLTSSATSGDVLAEALTTADFLENVPVLRNLARGSQKGGDAKQDVALNQPKALPYDGKGYLYLSGVSGNYASVPDAANLNGLTDFVMEAKDVYMSDWTTGIETFFAKFGAGGNAFTFRRNNLNINVYAVYGAVGVNAYFAHGLTGAATVSIRLTRDDTSVTCELDTGSGYVAIGSAETVPADAIVTTTSPIEIGGRESGTVHIHTGKISRARMWNNATMAGSPVLDVDFTATNVRHGDTKIKCATGQVVTINQSGNDPATVIKKSVLRFDGVNDFMDGLLNQTITDGYMFAAFSVLGDGGESYGHILDVTSTGQQSGGLGSFTFFRGPSSANNIRVKYNNNGSAIIHQDVFDSSLGDIMLEGKMQDGSQISKVNNANADNGTTTFSGVLNAEEFVIAADNFDGTNPALDLEFLALFPSLTDDQADSVRNYINNRNNVFSLIDSQGYYFFDPQSITDSDLSGATDRLTGSWEGRIVGSDYGDTSRSAYSGTEDDQPTSDKYKLTFADNTDNLSFSIAQAGWQVVGTSLGTFAYRVNANAVSELNLLGNLGNASYRQAGDLYGIILLPESATGADIEAARKLLIDRGAADASTIISAGAAWFRRYDIVEFKNAEFPDALTLGFAFEEATNLSKISTVNAPLCPTFSSAWKGCSALTSFPADSKLGTVATGTVNFSQAWKSSGLTSFSTPLPTATTLTSAWQQCTSLTSFSTELPTATRVDYAWWGDNSLSDFRTTDIKNSTNFTSSWQNCSALTSFPDGAKLGTEANNVNFESAWRSSGLTSFSTPLPSAGNCRFSWFGSNLTSFNLETLTATEFRSTWRDTNLSSFSTTLPNSISFNGCWIDCSSLTDFGAGVFSDWNPSSIADTVFHNAWDGCTSLTAQSVENILTSIDASGKYATSTGASGGSALADAGIDIDYNGDTLSAATNSAITSLKSKGWSIFINSVEQ